MIIKTFHVSHATLINQCYLAYTDGKGILIDPAWDYTQLSLFLETHAIELTAVLLTHSHYDHTDLAETFAHTWNIPVFMSSQEVQASGFRCTNLQVLNHLETRTVGTIPIVSILTPGHTTGSMCYLINQHLFSGDTVFVEGVGICDPDHVHALYDSVQFLKTYLAENTLVWPGHSFGETPGKNIAYLHRHNIYFQLERPAFVQFRMRKKQPDPFRFV